MKYRVSITKVIEATKTFEIEADDELMVSDLANVEAVNADFSSAEDVKTKYFIGKPEKVENPYIDQYGEPYDPESGDSLPAGGGLDKRCDYNAEALFAYYAVKNRDDIYDYLKKRGFRLSSASANCDVFVKGNTGVWYESYADGMWGYMHTELVEP
jgi:hypothetical protein